ncbi:MAG: beta-phosphoglucomutase [Spirochaetales bacterium]|nr:beta-phosphoglucomutase [Spirochaetales bacterium]
MEGWIFDLDGVITDTARYHYLAWQKLADEEGLPFDEEINEKLRGISRMASLVIILDGREYPEEKKGEMTDRKNRYYRDFLDQLNPDDILPGVIPFLDRLKSLGKKLAIGSASRNTEFILGHLGIGSYFDGVASGSFVTRAKPAPDVFIHAAGQIGLPVSRCVVVEDAQAGVSGALEGGFRAVGIGPAERVGHGHVRLDSTELLK